MTLRNLAIFAAIAAVLYWFYKKRNQTVVSTSTGSPFLGTAPNPIFYDENGNPVIVYSFS